MLLYAIENGVQGLDDRLVQAERRIVELEMNQSKTDGTPWKPELKKRPRPGWTWDAVIEAWVEKTPAKEIIVPKRAKLQLTLPEDGASKREASFRTPERRALYPLGECQQVTASNVLRVDSPLTVLFKGKRFAEKGSTLPSTTLKPIAN